MSIQSSCIGTDDDDNDGDVDGADDNDEENDTAAPILENESVRHGYQEGVGKSLA